MWATAVGAGGILTLRLPYRQHAWELSNINIEAIVRRAPICDVSNGSRRTFQSILPRWQPHRPNGKQLPPARRCRRAVIIKEVDRVDEFDWRIRAPTVVRPSHE